jgi:hypothetical protein
MLHSQLSTEHNAFILLWSVNIPRRSVSNGSEYDGEFLPEEAENRRHANQFHLQQSTATPPRLKTAPQPRPDFPWLFWFPLLFSPERHPYLSLPLPLCPTSRTHTWLTMMTIFLTLHAFLVLFASSVSAAPLTERAATPAWCSGLGLRTTDSPSANFTLAALNVTLPNANHTGAPLVLGQAGAIPGASFEVLSVCPIHRSFYIFLGLMNCLQTYATYPYNQWPSFGLIAGRLYPNSNFGTPSYSGQVISGTTLGFFTTSQPASPPPQQYCRVVSV